MSENIFIVKIAEMTSLRWLYRIKIQYLQEEKYEDRF